MSSNQEHHNSEYSSHRAEQSNEQFRSVDIVDFAVIAWRARFYIAGGLLTGLLFSVVFAEMFAMPRAALITLPLRLSERQSERLEDSLLTNYKHFLREPQLVGDVFDEAFKTVPAFKDQVDRNLVTREKFLSAQLGGLDEHVILKISKGSEPGTATLQIRLPDETDAAAIAQALLATINSKMRSLIAAEITTVVSLAAGDNEPKTISAAQLYKQLVERRLLEESRISTKVFEIESTLLRRLQESERDLFDRSGQKFRDNSESDEVLRLIAILRSSNSISESEAGETLGRYSALQADLAAIRESFTNLFEREDIKLFQRSFVPSSYGPGSPERTPRTALLPVYEVNGEMLEEMRRSDRFRFSPRSIFSPLLAGPLLGAILGFLVYCVMRFSSVFRRRFVAEIAERAV